MTKSPMGEENVLIYLFLHRNNIKNGNNGNKKLNLEKHPVYPKPASYLYHSTNCPNTGIRKNKNHDITGNKSYQRMRESFNKLATWAKMLPLKNGNKLQQILSQSRYKQMISE